MTQHLAAHPRAASRHLARILAVGTALTMTLGLAACAPAATEEAGSASATRTVETDFGPVEVPVDIERIVSVDFYTPAALVDVGVNPVGVVNSYFTDTKGAAVPLEYSSVVVDSGATSIGEYYELNIEAVAAAKPDVILATSDFLPLDDPLREQMEKIAPIITFSARDQLSWKTRADAVADLLGKQDELAPVKAAYEERLSEVREEHAELLATQSVTVFVPVEEEWGTYASSHFSSGVLFDLGAKFREQQDDEINEARFPNWFSYEELGRISNADIVLWNSNEDPLPRLSENAIWNNLPAVQSGLVYKFIPRSATGSYGWALDNLNGIDAILDQAELQLASKQG